MSYKYQPDYINDLCAEYIKENDCEPEVIYMSREGILDMLLNMCLPRKLEEMGYEDLIDNIASGVQPFDWHGKIGKVSIKVADSTLGDSYIYVGTEQGYDDAVITNIMEEVLLDKPEE